MNLLSKESLNWIYTVGRDGKQNGPAHLIGPDPETNTRCDLRVDNTHWESVPFGCRPDQTCERCAPTQQRRGSEH